MEIILLLAGVAFVAVGALIIASEARLRRGASEVPGRLIGFATGETAEAGQSSFHAVAEYAGPDGQTRYLEARVGSSAPMGSVGDPLTVFVQPADPEKAAIKSSLPYVLGGILALMGAISCAVFCARFRLDGVSLAGAAVVVGYGAFRLRGSVRDKRAPALAWQQWRQRLFSARVFSEA